MNLANQLSGYANSAENISLHYQNIPDLPLGGGVPNPNNAETSILDVSILIYIQISRF
jgi:hypothetical protein